MRRSLLAMLAVIAPAMMLTLGSQRTAQGAVMVTRVDYNGWKECYQLSNGTVELVFVPQIGRIMRYAFIGGPNMLWNNPDMLGKTTDQAKPGKEWHNYGGDKLWPSPQSLWTWPPDPIMDSGEQIVTITPDKHLLVEGHSSPQYGIRFQREIILEEIGPGVTFKNTMFNARRIPLMADPKDATKKVPDMQQAAKLKVTWGIWEIAQVDDPSEARLLINKKGHFPHGYYTFNGADPAEDMATVTPTQVHLRRNLTKTCKIGGDAPQGILEAVVHDQVFQISTKVEAGRNYPDEGCSQEIYTNPDPLKYVELELLGPIHTLEPEKSATFITHWTIRRD